MSLPDMKTKLSHSFWIFLIVLFGSVLPKSVKAQSFAYKTLLSTLYDSRFPTIRPSNLSDLSRFQVLDTREKEEFEVSHLNGARWVGYDTFNMESVSDLDKDKPVLVYCTVGARSQNIGKKLVDAGFKNVVNLYGGIIQWSNESMPLFQNNKPTIQVHTYSKSWGIWLEKGEKVH